jgi:hypothetical protein
LLKHRLHSLAQSIDNLNSTIHISHIRKNSMFLATEI